MARKLEARLPQLRVTPELKEALEAAAKERGIRVNDAMRAAIVEFVRPRRAVKVPVVGRVDKDGLVKFYHK